MKEIFTRRSIRRYNDTKVEHEKIEKILRAAMQAPSAKNQIPWEFLVLEEKETLKKFSTMTQYSKALETASVAILLLMNKTILVSPSFWEQDMAAAAQNILLEAVHLGLGGVWLGIAPEEDRILFTKELFNLGDTLQPFCVISLGYPAEGRTNKFIDRFDHNKIHYEKIGESFTKKEM